MPLTVEHLIRLMVTSCNHKGITFIIKYVIFEYIQTTKKQKYFLLMVVLKYDDLIVNLHL